LTLAWRDCRLFSFFPFLRASTRALRVVESSSSTHKKGEAKKKRAKNVLKKEKTTRGDKL